jgi:hypothetical protein
VTTDERHAAAIRAGEDEWQKASTGNWDESSWRIMGTALMLIREEVQFELRTNVARGGPYNQAFARRVDGTKFKTMHPVTRSNLLFCMEPENRVILDGLLARWTPDERARRTHPTTLAKAIREELKPKDAKLIKATSHFAALKEQLAEAQSQNEKLKTKLATAGQSLFDIGFDTPQDIGIALAENMSERKFDAVVKAAKDRYKSKKAKPAG